MMRRTTLRRTPLRRHVPLRPRASGNCPPERPLEEKRPSALVWRPATRRGTYGGPGAQALPKPQAHRNRRLLQLAAGEPCLLQVPGVCNRDVSTTVACHSNWGEHGKGGARKADDAYVVFGCSSCHAWLDEGRVAAELKRAIFDDALLRQIVCWAQIVTDPLRSPADRRAARWALERLSEDGTLPPAVARLCRSHAAPCAA